IGPRLREHRIGRANLTAAFPEKTPEEIENILMGVWDNLGRVGAEFAHMDHVWDYNRDHPDKGRIELPPRSVELFDQIQDDGKPVAMLIDQYLTGGVEVTFFGRKTRANPMLARLLRQVECPIHGVRIIRLPGGRFRGELTEEIKPIRDADGKIDIQGTTQAITSVVEGWVREHPEQWLWLHR